MSIQISGKQMDIGESLTVQIEDRLADVVSKYFGRGYSGSVVIEKQKSNFTTDCKLHLDSGITLQTKATEHNPTTSFDKAFEKIEKRLRRYTRKIKSRSTSASADESFMAPYKIMESPSDDESSDDLSPAIIAESSQSIMKMTVATAVMQLELIDAPILVFNNSSDNKINIVYWRKDGNIGWLDTTITIGS